MVGESRSQGIRAAGRRQVRERVEERNLFAAERGLRFVAEVAVTVPIPTILTYLVPEHMVGSLTMGLRVLVPVGGRKVTGFIVHLADREVDLHELKSLDSTLEDAPCLTGHTMALGLWVAQHYGAYPGESLEAVVPAAVRHGKSTRHELAVELLDASRAAALQVEHEQSAAWIARRRVLRHLLEPSDEPWKMRELMRIAEVSESPIRTLVKDGVLKLRRVAGTPDPFANLSVERSRPPVLTPEQAKALEGLLPALEARRFEESLLHGITGSGKTEVYLRLLVRCLELGRTAILLVPEIALTPQTVERILSRIPKVAVLHSGLSEGDRSRYWHQLRQGEVRVAVGPRSAVFAPLPDVGLIVMDEEHEGTFKQQQSPRYHAREVARERARLENALFLMGTATPSLETEARVRDGHTIRHRLTKRTNGRPLPEIGVVDARFQKPTGLGGAFTPSLLSAMESTLAAGEQVLLFLNRRGFSTAVTCRLCGWRAQCTHCAIALTHYRASERLLCHYCGHEQASVRVCPVCTQPGLAFGGFGTEKVAEGARQLFPGRRVARMDAETLRRRHAPEQMYQALRKGEIDILVGTQVLAKGIDVPGITLVGVISADTALSIPDFRSCERTFQLLCQVAGRAGRAERPGRVIIQTYSPEHYAIRAAARQDPDAFAEVELKHRRTLGYPPFGSLSRLVVSSENPERPAPAASELAARIRELPAVLGGEITVLGPAPCPLSFVKGEHRHHILLRSPTDSAMDALLPQLPRRAPGGVNILLDRDPQALL